MSDRFFFCGDGATIEGPFDLATLEKGFNSGRFQPAGQLCEEGTQEWFPARDALASIENSNASALVVSSTADPAPTFARDDQNEAAVTKIVARAKGLLTSGEEIIYVGVQKKPVLTIAPDAVLLTNKRFMVVRPKLTGMTFQDYLWREVRDVHMSEQLLGATITCTTITGKVSAIDSLPKKQARRIYTISQEAEEAMHLARRQSTMEETRAGASNFTVHSPVAPAAASAPDPMTALQSLKKMLDGGLIDAGEYERKKSEVLARL